MELAATEYKKFFEDTPVALMRADIETGKFLMANRFCSELLGYKSPEDLFKYCSIKNIFDSKDYKKLIKTIIRQGYVRDYHILLTLDSGLNKWISVSLHINCGGSCLEGTITDVTDSKLEEEFDKVKRTQINQLTVLNEAIAAVINSNVRKNKSL